ncbi:CsbD family protein [uncultured Sphingomonas sp.]|uniref:CsbD family protein n=1 Tax=uncultured Sphingomonas sp. TaxID=158754 RepID=UPI00261FC120|nr:CsbD family protein [uncultured Sphingomonas sp.]
MGELIDRIKGDVNEAVGKAKRAMAEKDSAARADKDAKPAVERAAQEVKSKSRQFIGRVKAALGDDF